MRRYIPNNEDCRFFGEFVLLSTRFKVYFAHDGIAKVDLAVDQVGKRWSARVCIGETRSRESETGRPAR